MERASSGEEEGCRHDYREKCDKEQRDRQNGLLV